MNPGAEDPYDLQRFVTAQRETYALALEELRRGGKRSHWMWYVFPQVAGLGFSVTAQRYAIRSRQEATAYLAHPLLGPRLAECGEALLQVKDKSATEIMGMPDDMKLRSSMTLFAAVAGAGSLFQQMLDRYFSGAADPRTLQYLEEHD